VERDSIGTQLVCNTGTHPTLHMGYDEEHELWYLIGSCTKVPAIVNVVTSRSNASGDNACY
jgi:hypothetical protein